MTRAQSSYLNRPLRTEAEVIRDRKTLEATVAGNVSEVVKNEKSAA